MVSVWTDVGSATIADPGTGAMRIRMPTVRPAAVPRTDRFDWTLVRSFLAVLDAGSLLGAARMLGAQQPTLSRQVAQLEAQLGAPLFERTGRGVVPTALALSITDAARQMAAGADALGLSLAGRRSMAGGTVRITTSEVRVIWMPTMLRSIASM